MIGLKIKKKLLAAGAGTVLALGTLGMEQAQAAVVTFDDLGNAIGPITNGYQGFNWNNFNHLYTPSFPFNPSGYRNGVVSLSNIAFNELGSPASVSVGSGQFDFNSAYLTGAWRNGLNILVEGFLGGVTKYSQTITVDSTSPTKFTFNYLGIDRLEFTSSGGVNAGYGVDAANFALDNLEYNATPVPEPLTILGTLTAAGMGVAMRRKQKQQQKATTKVG